MARPAVDGWFVFKTSLSQATMKNRTECYQNQEKYLQCIFLIVVNNVTIFSVIQLKSFNSIFFPEEILDDGVGLISETSGDSLDDDTELFSDYRDYEKVKLSGCLLQCFTAPLVA